MYRHNIEARLSEKTISITYSECVFVALVIQHAMLMRHFTLAPVTCLAVPYFPTFSEKNL
jgi:hypothetical protein